MIIKEIALSNFSVYAGLQRLRPAYVSRTNGKPITLIGGLNGTGKTSLLEGILLALYGRHAPAAMNYPRGYTSYLASLINRSSSPDDETFVELVLEVPGEARNQPVTLRVRRSWKIAKVRAVEHLTVWREDIEDQFLAEGWDSYVEELVPVGLAGLFFFDGEKIAHLAEAESTPESVKQAIRTMLGLDLVDRLIVDLESVIRRNQRQLKNSAVRQQLELAQKTYDQLSVQLRELHQRRAGIKSQLERQKHLLAQRKAEYLRLGGKLAENRERLEKDATALRDLIEYKRQELIALAGGQLPLLLVRPMLEKVAARVEKETNAWRAEAAYPVIQDLVTKLLDRLERDDSEATRTVTEVVRKVVDDFMKDLKASSQESRLFPLTALGAARLEEVLRSAPSSLLQLRETLDELRQLRVQMEQIERHLLAEVREDDLAAALNEILAETEKVAQLEKEYESIGEELARVENQLQRVANEIRRLTEQLVDVDEASRVIRYAVKSQNTMREFRERLTREKVTTLAARVTEAFHALMRKSTLAERVEIDPDTLEFTLRDASNRIIPRERLSSGEKQMMAVAILWGLARASGRKVPLIIDTPMARLDSSHRMNYLTEYLPRASHQVIILSTDTEVQGEYLRALAPYVQRSYLLSFDEKTQTTKVLDGYFEPIEGIDNAGTASAVVESRQTAAIPT